MKEKNKTLKQFIKFAVVGAANTFVDIAALTLLILVFDAGREGVLFSVFKAIAFTLAVANSYYFNKHWTFKGEGGQKSAAFEFSEFMVVSIIGAVINVGTASLVVNLVQPVFGLGQVWPQISALVATGVGLIWNFIGYKFFVFTKKAKTTNY